MGRLTREPFRLRDVTLAGLPQRAPETKLMSMKSSARLSPAQQQALDQLHKAVDVGNVLVLHGGVGSGKTTLLSELHGEWGGATLTLQDFVEAAGQRHPLSLEDALYQVPS